MEIEALRPAQIEPVASLLARAFDVDAGYRYLFPGPERTAGLTELFAANLRVHQPHGCTFVASRAQQPVATVTVRPPGGIGVTPWTMLRHGLLGFAWTRGPGAVRRLLWLKRTYDGLEREAAGGAPHWHVHMMVVSPGLQGQGVGGQLLREVLRRTSDTAPHPTVLTTHLEQNVTFYRRAGFEVTDDRQLEPPGGAAYRVWSMRRRSPAP
jgi:ribosomal protein S18 acetylase RimI-like enzyme